MPVARRISLPSVASFGLTSTGRVVLLYDQALHSDDTQLFYSHSTHTVMNQKQSVAVVRFRVSGKPSTCVPFACCCFPWYNPLASTVVWISCLSRSPMLDSRIFCTDKSRILPWVRMRTRVEPLTPHIRGVGGVCWLPMILMGEAREGAAADTWVGTADANEGADDGLRQANEYESYPDASCQVALSTLVCFTFFFTFDV